MTIDTTDVMAAARKINQANKALEWLRQYGEKLSRGNEENVSVAANLKFASACSGAAEARDAVSKEIRSYLPEAVTRAIAAQEREINDQKTVIAQWIKDVEASQ